MKKLISVRACIKDEREALIETIAYSCRELNKMDSTYYTVEVDEVRELSTLFDLQALRDVAYKMYYKAKNNGEV